MPSSGFGVGAAVGVVAPGRRVVLAGPGWREPASLQEQGRWLTESVSACFASGRLRSKAASARHRAIARCHSGERRRMPSAFPAGSF